MRAVVDGGLESVLDEHFWLRAQNLPEGSAGLAADLEQSIGLRAGGFSLHTLARNPEKIPVRCHVAVPFGDAEAEPVSRKGGEAITSTPDRKSTRLNSSTNAHLVCRLLLEKKKNRITHAYTTYINSTNNHTHAIQQ